MIDNGLIHTKPWWDNARLCSPCLIQRKKVQYDNYNHSKEMSQLSDVSVMTVSNEQWLIICL